MKIKKDEICEHDFRSGPFYLMAANGYEEPTFYPPSTMLKVEHCVKCGVLRLPERLRKYVGKNMVDGNEYTV